MDKILGDKQKSHILTSFEALYKNNSFYSMHISLKDLAMLFNEFL